MPGKTPIMISLDAQRNPTLRPDPVSLDRGDQFQWCLDDIAFNELSLVRLEITPNPNLPNTADGNRFTWSGDFCKCFPRLPLVISSGVNSGDKFQYKVSILLKVPQGQSECDARECAGTIEIK